MIAAGVRTARAGPRVRAALGGAWLAGSVLLAVVCGYAIALGYWYAVAAVAVAIPACVAIVRYPLAALSLWLAVTPLVAVTDSGAVRKVFWLVHRLLPLAVLGLVVLFPPPGRTRRLPSLGWPEALMGGYVVATLASIAYTSEARLASTYLLYDRVVAPMCLYLVVRLLEPGERDLARLVPAVAFLLLAQAVIGVASWTAPELLPEAWLGKVGERTTGSLRAPELYAVTVLFAGLYLLHAGESRPRGVLARAGGVAALLLALAMTFLTFSRSAWLAGALVLAGALALHRRAARAVVPAVAVLLVVGIGAGLLGQQAEQARERLRSEQSEESALSRLPVAYAALRMFAVRPVTGWGYENFDRFDRPFQGRVGNLFYPNKDHASHNLYLTTLAEQGSIGFVLLLGAPLYWLARARASARGLPATGLMSRRLVGMLWLALAAHVVVSSFYRMQISFGFGLWWLTLGLIASLQDGRER